MKSLKSPLFVSVVVAAVALVPACGVAEGKEGEAKAEEGDAPVNRTILFPVDDAAAAVDVDVYAGWFVDGFRVDSGPHALSEFTVDGERRQGLDVPFGTPPADAIVDGEDGDRVAVPFAFALDRRADIDDVAALENLGDLDDEIVFGFTSYLTFTVESASGGATGLRSEATGPDGAPIEFNVLPVGSRAAFGDQAELYVIAR